MKAKIPETSPNDTIGIFMPRAKWERLSLMLNAVRINVSGNVLYAEKAVAEARAEIQAYKDTIHKALTYVDKPSSKRKKHK